MDSTPIPLIAPDIKTKTTWVTGLRGLLASVRASRADPTAHWLKTSYLRLKDASFCYIDVQSMVEIFKSLGATSKQISDTFEKAGVYRVLKMKTVSTESVPFMLYETAYYQLQHRTDIAAIFKSLTKEEALTMVEFIDFLKTVQGEENPNRAKLMTTILNHEPDTSYATQGMLSLAGFVNFLNASENQAQIQTHMGRYMDMNQPLANYFIDSSHNTYLTAHQLKGTKPRV